MSFAFHFVFLLFLGLFPSFDSGKNIEEETRFVKLDSTQLAELEKMVNPKPPETKPAAVKPKLKKQAEPKLLKKKPVRVASKKKPSKTKKVSKKQQPSTKVQ